MIATNHTPQQRVMKMATLIDNSFKHYNMNECNKGSALYLKALGIYHKLCTENKLLHIDLECIKPFTNSTIINDISEKSEYILQTHFLPTEGNNRVCNGNFFGDKNLNAMHTKCYLNEANEVSGYSKKCVDLSDIYNKYLHCRVEDEKEHCIDLETTERLLEIFLDWAH